MKRVEKACDTCENISKPKYIMWTPGEEKKSEDRMFI